MTGPDPLVYKSLVEIRNLMNKIRPGKYFVAAVLFSFLFLSPGSSEVVCQGKADAELESFAAELNTFSKEIAGKLESDPTIAGIEAAQKIFDVKKQSMRERILELRKKEAEASAEVLKKLRLSIINGTKLLTDAFAKNAPLHSENLTALAKFRELITDYIETFYLGEFDGQIEAFIKEFDSVSKEMAEKMNKTPGARGMDDAQKVFDSKKFSLRERFSKFRNARGTQVSEVSLKKLTDSITSNGKLLTDTFTRHSAKYKVSPKAIPKFQKLMKDYTDIFAMM